ncbi:MAG: TIGR03620 family F420-dependent LLM class oxidoreductase [Myxococcota bacterium]|nr:TIGR03620 family F420-dependent LLM class oxidoreductase [Myxococcota bacterium]
MDLNPSVIFYTDALPAEALERFALRLEDLGYEALWVPEFFGREPFSTVSFVLARTTRLRVATGIANVYARDALVTAQARQTLAELSGGRFVLGLGVSHPPMAEAHGIEWVPPVQKMRDTLDVIEATRVQSPPPAAPAPIWIAAHGPGLLRLAAARTDGANTYLMPAAHTKQAREILGPEKRLSVVMPSCLCEDADRARHVARRALAIYMPLPAYRKQWKSWGFSDDDFEEGGSDRLIDTVVAWGSEAAIRERMVEHREAGASHIVVSALNPEGAEPHWKLYEALAS